MKLYKYKSIDINGHSIDMIKNGNLWFSNLGDLNDPFEGDYAINDDNIVQISKSNKFSKNGYDLMGRANRYVDIDREIFRRQFYILSLSEKCDDILMWSHYADHHRGIVIKIDVPPKQQKWTSEDSSVSLVENYSDSILHKVDYSGEPAYYDPTTEKEKEYGAIITRKTSQWKYEKEYRLIIYDAAKRSSGILVKAQPKIVKSVYFGMRVINKEIDRVICSIGRKDIKYHKMIMRHGHFQLTTIGA